MAFYFQVITLIAVTIACSNGLPYRPRVQGSHSLGGLSYGGFSQQRPIGGSHQRLGKRSAEAEPQGQPVEAKDDSIISVEDDDNNDDGLIHLIETRSAEPQHGGFEGNGNGHGGFGQGFEWHHHHHNHHHHHHHHQFGKRSADAEPQHTFGDFFEVVFQGDHHDYHPHHHDFDHHDEHFEDYPGLHHDYKR